MILQPIRASSQVRSGARPTRQNHNRSLRHHQKGPGAKEREGSNMKHSLALAALSIALLLAPPVRAADTAASDSKTIVFVCTHGSVKSQMAAAHFNKIARDRGLPYTAISRGIEVDESVPSKI